MSMTRAVARRHSGVLMPVSALQSPGQAALGDPALRFVDWLADAGFSVWQVLPLVPVDRNGSPYWSRSDRAGNPRLLDAQAADPGSDDDFHTYRAGAAHWLRDYTLFEALSEEQGGRPWWLWPAALHHRDTAALRAAELRLQSRIAQLAREQWRFDAQWQRLRAHAASRQVRLFGDLPIYVAPDSVATWCSREQFQLDAQGRATAVAGVPPDYFAADGQLWGNPLYDWPAQQRDGFAFWQQRLRLQADRFDLLRLDHFRGLEAYWSVPATAITAREGRWCKAPGRALLNAATRALPALQLIAEDLGEITAEVTALRREFALPGMRVLQFGFDGDAANLHLPHQHETDSVVYTGTHDNDTTSGWYASLDPATRDLVRRYLGRADHEIVDALVRSALASVGQLAVLPVQDILHLGSAARLNRPGTVTGNWGWCLPAQTLGPDLAHRYRELNYMHNRGS
jgi:4-alpha-glucanotransferase